MVEDDDALALTTAAFLEMEGFDVDVNPGRGVVDEVLKRPPDLLLLDLELPEETGLSICRRLRPAYKGPIVILTARDTDMDEVVGFELGCDEYLRKPVHTRLLLLRIRALLRRSGDPAATADSERYADPDLCIDRRSREVQVKGQVVTMTTAEFELLWYLVERVGQPISRDDYFAEVRGITYDGLDRSFDNSMSRIRRKLMDAGMGADRLLTLRGVGYQLTTS